MPFIKPAADFAVEIDAQYAAIARYFQAIASLGGNLPDSSLTDKTGPNDAAQRGLYLCEARRLALEALVLMGKPAPRCCGGLLPDKPAFPVLRFASGARHTSYWIGNNEIAVMTEDEQLMPGSSVTIIRAIRNALGLSLKDAKEVWDKREAILDGPK